MIIPFEKITKSNFNISDSRKEILDDLKLIVEKRVMFIGRRDMPFRELASLFIKTYMENIKFPIDGIYDYVDGYEKFLGVDEHSIALLPISLYPNCASIDEIQVSREIKDEYLNIFIFDDVKPSDYGKIFQRDVPFFSQFEMSDRIWQRYPHMNYIIYLELPSLIDKFFASKPIEVFILKHPYMLDKISKKPFNIDNAEDFAEFSP